MIFITHDQEEAFYLSDRIMVMDTGVIAQIDTPKKFIITQRVLTLKNL